MNQSRWALCQWMVKPMLKQVFKTHQAFQATFKPTFKPTFTATFKPTFTATFKPTFTAIFKPIFKPTFNTPMFIGQAQPAAWARHE